MATHSSILGESHGQRSLVGYNPWLCKELDTTELLTLSHFISIDPSVYLSIYLNHFAVYRKLTQLCP